MVHTARKQAFVVYDQVGHKLACPVMGGSRGGGKGSLKNHKNIEFLSNTSQDPLNNHKLPSQHSSLGSNGTPVKRHLNGVSLADR